MKTTASKLTFDEQRFNDVGDKPRLQSPGHREAPDRYEIEVPAVLARSPFSEPTNREDDCRLSLSQHDPSGTM